MDMELAKFLFQVLQFLLTGGIGVYVYLTNKNKVTNDRISRLEQDIDVKLDNQGERLASLEAVAGKSPTHGDLGALHEKINGVSEDVSTMTGELKGVADNVRLIMNRIVERGMQ